MRDDKNVSAEEARGLLAAFGDNRLVRLIGETDDETVIEVRGDAGKWGLTESIPDNLAGLLVAAPGLARTVISLHKRLEGVGVVECLAAHDDGTLHDQPRTMGIDPGRLGGIVVLDGLDVVGQRRANGPEGYHVHETRTDCHHGTMAGAILALVGDRAPDLVILEIPSWHAGKGRKMAASTAGRHGIEHGAWRGILAGLGWAHLVLSAQQWRPLARIKGPRSRNPKQATIAHVDALLPGLDLRPGKCTTDHDGLADAAGMALAARCYLRR